MKGKAKSLLKRKVYVERASGELRESCAFVKFQSFIRGQFSGPLSSLRLITLLCNPWLFVPVPSSPEVAHTPQPKSILT